jgi:hypothetical protein
MCCADQCDIALLLHLHVDVFITADARLRVCLWCWLVRSGGTVCEGCDGERDGAESAAQGQLKGGEQLGGAGVRLSLRLK